MTTFHELMYLGDELQSKDVRAGAWPLHMNILKEKQEVFSPYSLKSRSESSPKEQEGSELLSRVCSDRTKGNGFKSQWAGSD